jgi:HK97 family phage major capsid protein
MSLIVVTPKHIDWLIEHGHAESGKHTDIADPYWQEKVAEVLASGALSPDEYVCLVAAQELVGGKKAMATATQERADKVLGGGGVRVKAASEHYSEKRFTGRHAKTGGEIINPFTGAATETPSQRDYAKAGVLFKHLANRAGLGVSLQRQERDLLEEMATADDWAGSIGGEYQPSFTNVKALLDDATSGGIEITPTWFDDSVVTFPLLTGELLPFVDLRPVPRGRRVEGGSIGNPTISWGQGDNTEVSLFDTASLVAEINTSIFGAAVAIEIGRDFLSDAAVDVGAQLTALVGQALAAELDKLIANGNGTNQPQGIFQASGLTTVTPDTPGGAATLNDYITLMFSIGKQYRNPANRCAFLSNDTTYQRSRSIKIDTATPSTDQRPALAPLTEISSYSTLGWRHAVQNDLTNPVCAFGALSKYRLYRRQGMEIRFEQGGATLARKNLVLLVARARFGGRVVDANAFAKWTTGQA